MASVKKTLKEEYQKIKKALERIVTPKKEPLPQVVLQPIPRKFN